jgi:hypothetical protein
MNRTTAQLAVRPPIWAALLVLVVTAIVVCFSVFRFAINFGSRLDRLESRCVVIEQKLGVDAAGPAITKQPEPEITHPQVERGRIINLRAREITLLPDNVGKPSYTYRLRNNEEPSVRIDGTSATFTDLQPGMKASIFNGEAGLSIDAGKH